MEMWYHIVKNFVKGGDLLDLNWFESILYGLIAGLTDILPVSAQAHKILLLKVFGRVGRSDLLQLLIYLGIFGALYYSSQKQLVRMSRAQKLARVPKRRRKRPLDTRSLMDLSLLKTMILPVILSLFLYRYANPLGDSLILVVAFLFVNGVILYIPQYLPSGNRDSRTLSRVEGLLMGLGGGFGILPGISGMGSATAVASVCGIDRNFGLTMALMMNMAFSAGMMVLSAMGILNNGLEALSVLLLIRYILTGAAAFGGAMLGIRIMRLLASGNGYGLFGFYCWGLALFTFILNILA